MRLCVFVCVFVCIQELPDSRRVPSSRPPQIALWFFALCSALLWFCFGAGDIRAVRGCPLLLLLKSVYGLQEGWRIWEKDWKGELGHGVLGVVGQPPSPGTFSEPGPVAGQLRLQEEESGGGDCQGNIWKYSSEGHLGWVSFGSHSWLHVARRGLSCVGMELRPFLKTHTYTILNLEVNFQLDYPTGLPKFCIFKGEVLVLGGTEA